MQADLLVSAVQQPTASATGEWIPLEFTNYLLSMLDDNGSDILLITTHNCIGIRFGPRKRPYIAHTAKTLSSRLLKEFNTIWQSEFAVTSTHPFRGLKTGHPDVYMGFLFIHSVVERWREGLLWSWAVAKEGGLNNEWGDEEKARAWKDLGGKPGENEIVVKVTPRRSSDPEIVDSALRQAGHTPSGHTKYTFGESLDFLKFLADVRLQHYGSEHRWVSFRVLQREV